MNKYIYLIGIDAGKDTGMCFYNTDRKEVCDLKTTDFFGCIHELKMLKNLSVKVYIEDPNLNKPVFITETMKKKAVQVALRKAQNVGMNKREASLLIQWMKENGIDYETIRPTQKKLNDEQFRRITGYNKRSNQHVRDAAMLVYWREK